VSTEATPPSHDSVVPGPGAARFVAIDAATSDPNLPVDDLGRAEAHKFESAMRSEIHRLVIWALRFGAGILGILLVVRFWHLAAPVAWRWLSDTEVQSMDKMLFSSAFGGFVFSYLRDSVMKKHR